MDYEIDEKIYKLYGITDEEKEVIKVFGMSLWGFFKR